MKMLVSIILVSVLAHALSEPLGTQYFAADYHEEIGIPLAAKIRASEEAHDFDGSTVTRIVGGSPANLGEYPHFGGLLITLTDNRLSVCGSSLIAANKIVTAAHCWRHTASQASFFEIVFGSLSLYSGGTRVVTDNVVTHPNYFPLLAWNDIAVGTIPYVQTSSIISPIALPAGNLMNQNFVGQNANACGFGVQADGDGIVLSTHRLHHTTLSVISNDDCRQFFSPLNVIDSTLCIDGSDRRSTCGGDSGGPLQINADGSPVLIGITSFGFSLGCERGWPSGFARVTTFADWIRSQL